MYQSFTADEMEKIYLNFFKKAAEAGVTSMSEMLPGEYDEEQFEKYRVIRELEKQGDFRFGFIFIQNFMTRQDFSEALRWKKGLDTVS